MKTADELRTVSSMASEIRKLEAQLWHIAVTQHVKIVSIVSPERAEGKTTTAAYLATALAMHNDRRILAVDADFRCPKLATHFGVERSLGLADVIRGECDISQAIVPTSLPGLDVICPSAEFADPELLINTAKLRDIFEVLRPSYDLILVDTPAMLPVFDAAATVPLADGVLLIAMAGRTNRHHLGRARDLCLRLGTKILGLVVCNIQEAAPEYLTTSSYTGAGGQESANVV